MTLTLRCTHVTPHADGTQSVSLQEQRAAFPPTPRIMEAGGAAGNNLRIGPGPIPLPAPRAPVQVLLTNISNERPFQIGQDFRVDIQPV